MPQVTVDVRHKTDGKQDDIFQFNVSVGDTFAKIKAMCLEKCGKNVKICQQKRVALHDDGKSLREVRDDFPIYEDAAFVMDIESVPALDAYDTNASSFAALPNASQSTIDTPELIAIDSVKQTLQESVPSQDAFEDELWIDNGDIPSKRRRSDFSALENDEDDSGIPAGSSLDKTINSDSSRRSHCLPEGSSTSQGKSAGNSSPQLFDSDEDEDALESGCKGTPKKKSRRELLLQLYASFGSNINGIFNSWDDVVYNEQSIKAFCNPIISRTVFVLAKHSELLKLDEVFACQEYARSLVVNFIQKLYPDLAVHRQEVARICVAFSTFTGDNRYKSASAVYGNGNIDDAVRSRKSRMRKIDGTIGGKRQPKYDSSELQVVVDRVRKMKDMDEIRTAFASSSDVRLHFHQHASDADLDFKGIVDTMVEKFPVLLKDVSLLENDYYKVVERNNLTCPDYANLLPGWCDAINVLAEEAEDESDICLQFEDDKHRAALINLYKMVKRESRRESRYSKMDASRLFIGGEGTRTLDQAMSVVTQKKYTHPCILMVNNVSKYEYYICADRRALKVNGGALDALHWLFAVHQVFNLQYDKDSDPFYRFMERIGEVRLKFKKWTTADDRIKTMIEMKVAELTGENTNPDCLKRTPTSKKSSSARSSRKPVPLSSSTPKPSQEPTYSLRSPLTALNRSR